MRKRIVSRACRVCCFCCSGDPVRGHSRCPAAGEEGGKERHDLCQRQAILHQEALQLAQLRGGLSLVKRRATRSSRSISGYSAVFW